MKRFWLCFALSIPTAWGDALDCMKIQDDVARLGCYDKKNGFSRSEKVVERPEAVGGVKELFRDFSVRDEGTYQKLGKNPASIQQNRVKGEDASSIKAAVIWKGPALTDSGLQPFASYSINRNTLASARTDLRTSMLGLTATLGDYLADGYGFWPMLRLSDRQDKKDLMKSSLAVLDTVFVYKPWVQGIPFESGYVFAPRVGAAYENVREKKMFATGTYKGGFISFEGSYWPTFISDRLEVRAKYQRYTDQTAPTSLAKRLVNYSSLAFDIYLFPPSQKDYWLQPVIGIEREVGNDPLTGKTGLNSTTIGLKLLVN